MRLVVGWLGECIGSVNKDIRGVFIYSQPTPVTTHNAQRSGASRWHLGADTGVALRKLTQQRL
jgi:hypothetical protein